MKKQALPIDGKSILDEWIFDNVFYNGYMATIRDSVRYNSILGITHGMCVLAEWEDDGTIISFECSGFDNNYKYDEAKIQEFIHELNTNLNSQDSFVEAVVRRENNTIYVQFYDK